jgi:hypothetical protein
MISIGGIDLPGRAQRAGGAPFRIFSADEAGTIEAWVNPRAGARSAGVVHFVITSCRWRQRRSFGTNSQHQAAVRGVLLDAMAPLKQVS